MEHIVYFPSFEPPDSNWLKFALLYVENFNPIIPYAKMHLLSDDYRRIIDETDLITPYNPQYDQGERASIKAMDFLEAINRNPSRYYGIFHGNNVNRGLRNPANRLSKIYNEKFSLHWADFCVQNHYGERTDDGILVTEELAFIFMTFLAEEIAFVEGKSIITDNVTFDNFLNYQKAIPRTTRTRQELVQGVLGLSIPKNIAEIPIENLVRFRNRHRNKISAFNSELDSALRSVQEGLTDQEFLDRFNNIYSDLAYEIITQGFGVSTIPLSTYLLLQSPNATSPEYINQIVGGLGIVLTAGGAINSRWRDIQTRVGCKRYLTNLSRLR